MKKVVQILILGCLCVLGGAVELRGMEEEAFRRQQEEIRRKRAKQWEEKKSQEAAREAETTAEITRLTMMAKGMKKLSALEKAKNLQQETLKAAEVSLKQLEQQRDELYVQKLGAEEALSDLESQLQLLHEAQPAGGRSWDDIRNEIQKISLEHDMLKLQIPPVDGMLADLEKDIAKRKREVSELRVAAEIEVDVAVIQAELDELEKASAELRKEIDPEPVSEQIKEPDKEPDGQFIKQVTKKQFPTKTVAGIGVGVAAAVITAGAVYAGLKWYQRKRIASVIDKFDLELSSFSSTQKDAMAAAVLASSRVPGSMWNLKRIVQKGEFATDAVSAETMWKILAPLYYRKPVTSEDIQMLQERIQ